MARRNKNTNVQSNSKPMKECHYCKNQAVHQIKIPIQNSQGGRLTMSVPYCMEHHVQCIEEIRGEIIPYYKQNGIMVDFEHIEDTHETS